MVATINENIVLSVAGATASSCQENQQKNFDMFFVMFLPPGVASSRSICERAKKIPNSKTETPRAPISFPQPIPHQKRNHCGGRPLRRRRNETWRRKIMNRLTRIWTWAAKKKLIGETHTQTHPQMHTSATGVAPNIETNTNYPPAWKLRKIHQSKEHDELNRFRKFQPAVAKGLWSEVGPL